MDCISIPFQCVKCKKSWAISHGMKLKYLKNWYDRDDLRDWNTATPDDCIKTECADCQLSNQNYFNEYESINNYE